MTALLDKDTPSADDSAFVRRPGRLQRLWRGRPDDGPWVRPALLALLAGAALLYLWDLGASGWGNAFYSAAAQAGSQSWKAWFFGASDASSFITVDKPPGSLWIAGLSGRVFGVSSWSLLAPQALEGVAAVGLLYLTVRRCASATAGLIAGAVFALTPVAVLMFRFNNPDALLVLLLIGAAYCVVRALENASTRWLVGAGVCVGFGFLTKQLQAFLVLPVLAPVYLYAAPTPFGRCIRQLVLSGLAVLVSAGWWIAAVALTPASVRPYVGGSQHNSILELTFGYNGLGRLTGNETGSVGGGGGATGPSWGPTGVVRMFTTQFGGEVSWLIPGALLMLAGALWLGRHAPRADMRRAGLVLWGLWLVVTGLTFSLAKGIIHPYYTVALAPAIGALVGIGAVALWSARRALVARLVLAAAAAVTAWWAVTLLDRAPTFHPGLRVLVAVTGILVALMLAAGLRLPRRAGVGVLALGLVTVMAAPAVASMATASVPHTGAIPSSSPVVARGFGGQFGGQFGGAGGPGGGLPPGAAQRFQQMFGGQAGAPPAGAFGGRGGRGGAGGLLDAGTISPALVTALRHNASSYTWAAAAVGSNSAAGPQLASGEPVMAIGGFNGTDPTPTLAGFQALVKAGRIHYFITGGGGFGGRGGFGGGATNSTGTQITTWVTSTYRATTVGGTTVYDLTAPS